QGTQGTQGTQGSQGDSIQGNPGLKTANGLLYYQSASATAPSKTGLTGTYNFSTNAVSLTGTGSTNWSVDAPVFQASNGNNYWYVRFTVTESSSGSNAGTLVLGTVSQTIGFSGLVTFSNNTITNGSSSFNYTAIDGSAITTGSITSTNYQVPTPSSIFAGLGTKFNLTDGSITSKNFVIDTSGNATFNGTITGGSIASTALISDTPASTVVSNAANGATAYSSLSNKLDKQATYILGTDLATNQVSFKTSQYDLGSGLVITNTGILGKKSGITTFAIDTNGDATFTGVVTASEIFTAASGNRIELNKKTSGTGDNRLKVYNQTNGQILSIGGNGSESVPPISIS
ncbi:MAG: hypothetical protein EBS58_07185, partial [Micrococcales bacterium]|nr:hypothetical protein [Micrococcales bacterium]